jgi:hypothetical protein
MDAAKSAAPRLMACIRGLAAAISSTWAMPAALSMMTSKPIFFVPTHRRLDRGHERVDGVDVGGVPDLRDHDDIEPVAGLFQQVDHVAVPIGRVEPVDPHAQRLVAPIDGADRLDDTRARRGLVIGGHGVLEVEVDHIRSGSRHLFEDRRARARAEQLAAVGTGDGLRLNAEAHGRNLRKFLSLDLPQSIDCCAPKRNRCIAASRRRLAASVLLAPAIRILRGDEDQRRG